MNSFILYLLRSAIGLSVFYIVFRFFLRRETSFVFIRIYLLLAILIPLILPLIHLSLPGEYPGTGYIWLDELVITPGGMLTHAVARINYLEIAIYFYLAGAFITAVRLLRDLHALNVIMAKSEIIREENMNIIYTRSNVAPFSFLNKIFLPSATSRLKSRNVILKHEAVHINQMHSVDLLFAELLIVLQWFNPFAWKLKSAMKINHEFLADRGVISRGVSLVEYHELLINQVFEAQIQSISNSFYQSQIKKRISMMKKAGNNRFIKMILLALLALLISVSFSISFTKEIAANQLIEQNAVIAFPELPSKDTIFTVVDEFPQFPGGEEARIHYILEHLKYPTEARNKGIQGTVYISFVIEENGKVTYAKVLRGIGSGCDEEALRVISGMPAWTPGKNHGNPVRVQFNIPVKFKLDNAVPKPGFDPEKGTVPPPPPPQDK